MTTTGREEQAREACALYVRLRGLFWELPRAHPARATLAMAVAQADQEWRRLVGKARDADRTLALDHRA